MVAYLMLEDTVGLDIVKTAPLRAPPGLRSSYAPAAAAAPPPFCQGGTAEQLIWRPRNGGPGAH